MATGKKTGKPAAKAAPAKGSGRRRTAAPAKKAAAPARATVKSKPTTTSSTVAAPNQDGFRKYAASNIYRSGNINNNIVNNFVDNAAALIAPNAALLAMSDKKAAPDVDIAALLETAALGIEPTTLPASFTRADLEFHDVDHSGASYEGRVFLNNPAADETTAPTAENGYAGSFHVFGHGGCYGDVGHCEINREQRDFDPRLSNALKPIKKVVIATDAIRRAMTEQGTLNVTVVPLLLAWTDQCDLQNVLKFDHISLVTYD